VEVGCASLSDRTTECIREGVVGTIFGVGGCMDERWPGFGVWAVLFEREADLESERGTSLMERGWLEVGKPPWASKGSREDLGEGSRCCAAESESIRVRLLLATEGEGECCSALLDSVRFLESETEPVFVG
jgi:hypothetical protein